MLKRRVFISFDAENDSDLRTLLVNQSRWDDSPFDLADWSVKAMLSGDWELKVRNKIRMVDLMIVICGAQTHIATGVSTELRIAQDIGIPYFLLWGRSNRMCRKPLAARPLDKIYEWTWPTLKSLIGGER